MTDFNAYKAGDRIQLQISAIVADSYLHCSCPEYSSKEIIAEFSILHIIKRSDDFILIFERSGVFDEYIFGNDQDDSTTLIKSFILDTADMKYGYIKVVDEGYQAKQKFEAIKNLNKIIKDKLQRNEQYRTEFAELENQAIALDDFPESQALKLVLNQMTDINIQINNNKAAINKANIELEKYAR